MHDVDKKYGFVTIAQLINRSIQQPTAAENSNRFTLIFLKAFYDEGSRLFKMALPVIPLSKVAVHNPPLVGCIPHPAQDLFIYSHRWFHFAGLLGASVSVTLFEYSRVYSSDIKSLTSVNNSLTGFPAKLV